MLMDSPMKQTAGLTEKQGAILEALGAMRAEEVEPGEYSVREIIANIRADGSQSGWIGIDPEAMRMTLRPLLLRGYVARREYIRVRTIHARWRWWITDAGWEALMRFYDEKNL